MSFLAPSCHATTAVHFFHAFGSPLVSPQINNPTIQVPDTITCHEISSCDFSEFFGRFDTSRSMIPFLVPEGGSPERDGGEGAEGLVFEYSSSWINAAFLSNPDIKAWGPISGSGCLATFLSKTCGDF